ncbi:MAG: patatin-like phospholipase family protein [Bacteroidales bacterium]|nr:patatin-like phospholipase family protein [Bacteroidales bacterium]MDD3009997.1 patatin-like phospholipase family protein [Bacteroidales bacterium]MDD3960585.1 patatin-like phospholipase family protein [Bacteroidales bacterium]MDY0284823.1 patatin-like phospholipase family protein [Bacteroidales bacterium]HPE86825.1 patatin-like phospholipase family protein [Bacteroidales bacterium]
MKNIGLALGGGAVLGAAHIGVLRALDEFNIKIDAISGTSIGAFVAVFFAFGKNWEEINAIASELKWIDITAISLSRYGLLSNDKLGDLIIEHLGDQNIEDARIPLAIVATDVTSGDRVILKKGSIAEAVMASTCIPGIFKPVVINDRMLVDGGIVENVPIHTARELGVKTVIGVDLNARHTYQKPGNILDVILNSFHYLMQHSDKYYTRDADLLIEPGLDDFNRSDMRQVGDLIRKGHEDAREALKNSSLF